MFARVHACNISVHHMHGPGCMQVLGTVEEDLTVPDICLANFYSGPQSQLGVHQDRSESRESTQRGEL